MDHFRPLYKIHRRGPVRVFDPQTDDSFGDFFAQRTAAPIDEPLKAAYAAFGLEPENCPQAITFSQLPGLILIPQMLTIDLQKKLVQEATTEYLVDRRHKTNFDAHMDLVRPIDLFSDCTEISKQQLQRKLRWVTLGGQYNWTTKVYPSFEKGSTECPEFPARLEKFVNSAFSIYADAAIVNYYSEGDILSPHQDVAELAKSDLISISLGCDCVFYIGMDRYDCEPLPILLRSGDVLVMGGLSRWAYHGVGRVFGETCPFELEGELGEYIRSKRININIRQMFDRE